MTFRQSAGADVSGEGVISGRPAEAPNAHSRIDGRPGVVTRLGSDGVHRVCLLLSVPGRGVQPVDWDPDTAARIGRELIEYAALLRERTGLAGGVPFRPTASLHEGGA